MTCSHDLVTVRGGLPDRTKKRLPVRTPVFFNALGPDTLASYLAGWPIPFSDSSSDLIRVYAASMRGQIVFPIAGFECNLPAVVFEMRF